MFHLRGWNRVAVLTILVSSLVLLLLTYFASDNSNIGAFRSSLKDKWAGAPLSDNPELTRPPAPFTAVLVYLIDQARAFELLDSLASVYVNLPGQPWPILLFHRGDFDDVAIQETFVEEVEDYLGGDSTSALFAGRLEFVKLDWKLPDGIPDDVHALDPVEAFQWPEYHHTCAFFAADIFSHPRLRDVTYYMRMDTSSLIEARMCYDPFEVMHVKRKAYGYRALGNEPKFATTEGLLDYVDDYARRHSGAAERLRRNEWEGPLATEDGERLIPPAKAYYNSFEIVKLQDFRRPDVREFLGDLMSVPERIYKWSWGDAPLRYATVQMFFDKEQDTEEFCGMRYFHPEVPTPSCSCVPLAAGGHLP